MENILNEGLVEGEKLLWSSRPEPFETLDKTHKKHFINKIIISAIVTIALCVAYVLYANYCKAGVKSGVIIILIGCGIFAVVRDLMDASKLKKGVMYAITDKRLILVTDSAKGVEYSCINEVRIGVDEDGHASLLCGDRAVKTKPYGWRESVLAGVCLDVDTGVCESFAMYAIPDADKVAAILKNYLPL